ncbi:MAG: hypothetical protein JWM98_3144, partial [Thermoleophilia bacterium]|nr:hypothetical protein [Thermoleophilia bacterium]
PAPTTGPTPMPSPGPAPTPPQPTAAPGSGYADAADAPNSAGSGQPGTATGPADLAVGWWPQDISLHADAAGATLRFQSTIVNLGGAAAPVHAGDRVEYTVQRTDRIGTLGEVVARGSAPLGRGDVQPFPVDVGEEVGHDINSFGTHLADITSLAPQHAAIVGAGQATQALHIADAAKGMYVLRQTIVHADGSHDAVPTDDERATEFILDGAGGILHTSSRYSG